MKNPSKSVVHRMQMAELEVEKLNKKLEEDKKQVAYWKNTIEEKEKLVELTKEQFNDLKQRLHASEIENARLRGYVQRVQEDDVVREDLIATGPDEVGCTRMVPKRKHAPSVIMSDMTELAHGTPDYGADSYIGRQRTKPQHWISY